VFPLVTLIIITAITVLPRISSKGPQEVEQKPFWGYWGYLAGFAHSTRNRWGCRWQFSFKIHSSLFCQLACRP
jgi:hypothetical protein